jgi:hypothetical protein
VTGQLNDHLDLINLSGARRQGCSLRASTIQAVAWIATSHKTQNHTVCAQLRQLTWESECKMQWDRHKPKPWIFLIRQVQISQLPAPPPIAQSCDLQREASFRHRFCLFFGNIMCFDSSAWPSWAREYIRCEMLNFDGSSASEWISRAASKKLLEFWVGLLQECTQNSSWRPREKKVFGFLLRATASGPPRL